MTITALRPFLLLLLLGGAAGAVTTSTGLAEELQKQADVIADLLAKQSALATELISVQQRLQEQEAPQLSAFHVMFSGETNAPMDAGSGGTLHFDQVVTNVGGGYDQGTGMFTAPHNGVYYFSLGTMPWFGYVTELVITMTGKQILAKTYGGRLSVENLIRDTVSATVHLEQGQQVWVEHHYGQSVVRQGFYTTFTGFLVQPS